LKLASLVDAAVIPCVILAGRDGTTVALGGPLDPADVTDRRRHRDACEEISRFFLKAVRSAPGQCDPWLFDRLRPRAQDGELAEVGDRRL